MISSLPPVVDAAWLAGHRADVVVADVRHYLDGRSGRAAYDAGHLDGAVFVDLGLALAAPGSPQRGRHPLPEPEHFAAELGALGIADADPVVAYDDGGGAMAARLVWMLRAIGAPAALLDGGIDAWEEPLRTVVRDRVPARRTPIAWPRQLLAEIDEVAAATVPVLDARAPERYRGEVEPIDPRAGHIPGARSVPFAGNLDEHGRFRASHELRERFLAAGVQPGQAPIAYCGSGVTACHVLLGLEAAGLGPGRLFPGSWSQWSSDPRRPAEKDGA